MAKTKPRERGEALFLDQLPPGLRDAFKAKAESRGRSMKWLIVQFMQAYSEKGDEALPKDYR